MKFYTVLPKELKPHFDAEIKNYAVAWSDGQVGSAWRCLERAHIIGQKYPFAHSFAHWKMLQFGFKTKNLREIIGQLPRLLTGGVKSFVGKVPEGNPGGANVPPLKPFPIEDELQMIINKIQKIKGIIPVFCLNFFDFQ